MARDRGTIRTIDLLGVFWRSFFVQASWSYERMQSLGFAFAMAPVLRRLYQDADDYSSRLVLHTEYFNTQPYLASFVLGAAARLEEERATGAKPGADVSELKNTLMAPLGALGDSFFWGSLKPLASATAVAALLAGAWWAPLLFVALYNIWHVGLRLGMIFFGYSTGGDVVLLMSRYNFTKMARLFKALSLSLTGCILGMISIWRQEFRPPGALPAPVAAAAGLLLVLGMIALLRAGMSPVKLMLGLAAACLALSYGGVV